MAWGVSLMVNFSSAVDQVKIFIHQQKRPSPDVQKLAQNIGEHHHRDQHFNEKMNQLLLHYKDQIKQTLSNSDIFHIFENNKKIVLFLIQKGIITISDEIWKEMINKIEKNGNRYWHFFIPELENFVGEEKMKFVKDELLKEDQNFFTNYEEKRQEGENDSYICSLIRQDSVEDFISHVNRNNISPSSVILPSIFETNPFLIDDKNTTLIEYSAFFGSIQIFRYLLKKTENDSQQNEEIISNSIKYHNYSHFQNDSIINYGWFYLSFYHYDKLFKLLLKKKEKSIDEKMIQFLNIQTAIEKDEVEVMYYHLLKMQEITKDLFDGTEIKQIVIPSSVHLIGD